MTVTDRDCCRVSMRFADQSLIWKMRGMDPSRAQQDDVELTDQLLDQASAQPLAPAGRGATRAQATDWPAPSSALRVGWLGRRRWRSVFGLSLRRAQMMHECTTNVRIPTYQARHISEVRTC